MLCILQADSTGYKASHNFVPSTYIPVLDEYCYREEGYLKITDVTADSLTIDISVSSRNVYEGSLECRALIEGNNYAVFNEDHGEDIGRAEFTFWLSPDKEYVFLEYSGPGLYYHGAGVCLNGFYKRKE